MSKLTLKELFLLILNNKSYDLAGIDTSEKSRKELIGYLSREYTGKVEALSVLDFPESILDELLNGDDLALKISAALSKINLAIPHVKLKKYV